MSYSIQSLSRFYLSFSFFKSLVVFLHQLMALMDEYFPNAQAFVPERWIKGDPLESHHHKYVVLPFGFGTRMCIGRRLAELEMWQLTTKVKEISMPNNYIEC